MMRLGPLVCCATIILAVFIGGCSLVVDFDPRLLVDAGVDASFDGGFGAGPDSGPDSGSDAGVDAGADAN